MTLAVGEVNHFCYVYQELMVGGSNKRKLRITDFSKSLIVGMVDYT